MPLTLASQGQVGGKFNSKSPSKKNRECGQGGGLAREVGRWLRVFAMQI